MNKPAFFNSEFGGKFFCSLLWVFFCIIPTYQLIMNNDPQHHWLRLMNLLLYFGMVASIWIPFAKNFGWFYVCYAVVVVLLDLFWVFGIV